MLPHATALERNGVVPVPSHVGATGHVAGGYLDAVDLGQAAQACGISEQTIRGLARRWLSYVLSQFETSSEVVASLAPGARVVKAANITLN